MKQTTPTPFPLTIDYTQPLPQMIAAGNYGWVNSDITSEHFPVNGEGKQEIITLLMHFGRNMSYDAVIAELNRRGLRPATIVEPLAFDVAYPEEQRKFPIIAPGSVAEVRGRRSVPCLYVGDAGRYLRLSWCHGGWGCGCRFLAVRK